MTNDDWLAGYHLYERVREDAIGRSFVDSVREKTRHLARQHLDQGKYLEWFDALYSIADGDASIIPWADLAPNPNLVEWLDRKTPDGRGKRALVVGCGLGDDAAKLAQLGFDVTAFDISPTAIEWCRQRFPTSKVEHQVANLLDLPTGWRERFDLVVESYTLQSLPRHLLPAAMESVAACVAESGTLLVICRACEPDDQGSDGPPWPLSRNALDSFQRLGLTEIEFEDFVDHEEPPVRRFRVEYRALR